MQKQKRKMSPKTLYSPVSGKFLLPDPSQTMGSSFKRDRQGHEMAERFPFYCRGGAKITVLTLAFLFQDQGLASMQLFTFSFLWCLFGFAVAIKTTLTGTLPRLTSSMPLVCPVSWWWSTFRALSTQVSAVPEQLLLSRHLVDSIVV